MFVVVASARLAGVSSTGCAGTLAQCWMWHFPRSWPTRGGHCGKPRQETWLCDAPCMAVFLMLVLSQVLPAQRLLQEKFASYRHRQLFETGRQRRCACLLYAVQAVQLAHACAIPVNESARRRWSESATSRCRVLVLCLQVVFPNCCNTDTCGDAQPSSCADKNLSRMSELAELTLACSPGPPGPVHTTPVHKWPHNQNAGSHSRACAIPVK